MRPETRPFQFSTGSTLVKLTNRRAGTLWELHSGLQDVSGSTIFEHTYHSLLERHFVPAIPQTDIAHWVGEVLRLRALGEQLALVDPYEFTEIRALRNCLVEIIGEHFRKGEGDVAAPEGQEFHFLESVTVVTPTPFIAHDLKSFREALSQVGLRSIHHHFLEARLRLGRKSNDFSVWLAGELHETDLANRFEQIDFGISTLEDVRVRMLEILAKHQTRKRRGIMVGAGLIGSTLIGGLVLGSRRGQRRDAR